MELTQLPQDERASAFEKILLMTGAINFFANNVQSIGIHSAASAQFHKDNNSASFPIFEERAEQANKILEETVDTLMSAFTYLADFCNACDAVASIDMSYSEAVINAVTDMAIKEGEETI